MINKFFAKLTVLIITMLLTGCAAALGSAVGSVLLDEVTKGVVNNVLTPEQSAKTAPTTANNQTSQNSVAEVKPSQPAVIPTENNMNNQAMQGQPVDGVQTANQNTANTNGQPQCQHVDQAVNLPNGQVVHEKRIACLDEKTGSWRLVQ
jgi:hypothetical protein